MNLSFALGGALGGWLYDWSGSFTATVVLNSALVLALGASWTWIARGVQGPELGLKHGPAPIAPE